MLNWINSNGLEAIGLLIVIQLIAGTVPPLPEGAGFVATWLYLLLKALSFNLRSIGTALGVKMPEMQLTNIPGMKITPPEPPKE